MRLFIFVIIFFFSSRQVCAQEVAPDTIHLGGILIRGLPVEKFSVGYKVISFDSSDLESFQYMNVGQYLSSHSPLFFKSYGNGMASTVSFRGTGPSHTAVLWNGLPLNQPSLGLTDFSLLPLMAVDRIMMQFGPASSLFGSDAIGGSILLSSGPDWNYGLRGGFLQEFTDYGQSFSSLMFNVTGHSSGSKTRLYLNNNPNYFSFKNLTKQGQPVEIQKNAGIMQGGILQEFYFKPGKFSQVVASGWYNESYRELQPIMSVNNSSENLREKSLRISLDSHFDHPGYSVALKAGYLMDNYLFKGTENSGSQQFIAQAEGSKRIRTFDARVGTQFNHIIAHSDSYAGTVMEDRLDVFGNLRWNPVSAFSACLNVRQQFVTGFYSPFAPSLGTHLMILNRQKLNFAWTCQVARSYRIPTLNDRYWVPGGNRLLNPEKGISFESGLAGNLLSNDYHLDWSVNLYHMEIQDWIIWMPAGEFWTPRNIKEVWASGLELNLNVERSIGLLHTRVATSYSYTKSIDHSQTRDISGIYGKQLPYTPLHNGKASVNFALKSWLAYLNYNYTGERYLTADNSSALPSYQILDAGFGRKFQLFYGQFSLLLMVNNIFNMNYQVMNLRAMPLRNYGVSLKYMFN
jgi:vitamin B12 transporter